MNEEIRKELGLDPKKAEEPSKEEPKKEEEETTEEKIASDQGEAIFSEIQRLRDVGYYRLQRLQIEKERNDIIISVGREFLARTRPELKPRPTKK